MATTTTWTFDNTYDGFSFEEIVITAPATATRSKVSGGFRVAITMPALPDRQVTGRNESPDYSGIMPILEAGDQLEVDYSAVSDTEKMSVILTALYTDSSSDTTVVSNTTAGTLTLALTAGKRIEHMQIDLGNKSSLGQDHFRDIEELRLTTAQPLGDITGFAQTTSAFISDQGAGAAGGAGGSFDSIADISGDGLYIYLAAFDNSGFPILIKILSTLTQDGSIVFAPNAGGRIGVQTGKFNADHIFVAGQFDGTNTVEKSEDAGASFSVIDDGTFGTIRTFDIGPDSDDRIILFDGDNGDIIQSVDGGTTWTTINASVTPLINSIARYGQNPEEIAAGNQGGVTDSINYSPNTGVDLADYQTGVYPNANATKVATN